MKIQIPISYSGPIVSLFRAITPKSSDVFDAHATAAYYTKIAIIDAMAEVGIAAASWRMVDDFSSSDPASKDIRINLITENIDLAGAKAIENNSGSISRKVFDYVLKRFVSSRSHDTVSDISANLSVFCQGYLKTWDIVSCRNVYFIGCLDDESFAAASVFSAALNQTGSLPAGVTSCARRYRSFDQMLVEVQSAVIPFLNPEASQSVELVPSPFLTSASDVSFPSFPVFNPDSK